MKKPKSFKPRRAATKKKKVRRDTERNCRQSMYQTKSWKTFRHRFLHANPRCFCCGEKSTVVDHIVAHKGDSTLFSKIDNFIPLCSPCHNFITGKFDSKKEQDLTGKMKWVKSMRDRNDIKTTVKIVRYDK